MKHGRVGKTAATFRRRRKRRLSGDLVFMKAGSPAAAAV
jgi:hypothetical protein